MPDRISWMGFNELPVLPGKPPGAKYRNFRLILATIFHTLLNALEPGRHGSLLQSLEVIPQSNSRIPSRFMPHDHETSPMVTVPTRRRGDIDLSEYRRTLGTFATGITIVTTRDGEGRPVGITVNSFNSVSLDPPLILWSLAKAARSFTVFDDSPLWAVHILSAHQEQLSRRFATCGAQKFAGVDLQRGLENLPLLRDCCARLQCKTVFKCEAGDHLILIGEVLAFDHCNLPPLVFQAGRYSFLPRTEAANTCSAATG